MKSRLIAGLAAVLLAVVGAVLTFGYAQGADQRAVKNLDPVAVLVVKKAIPAGTPVESIKSSVATEQLPGTAVAKSALKTLDGQDGKVTSADLVVGEQLVSERLVAQSELKTPGSVTVPKGLLEVSFQVEPQRIIGGRLSPGEHVGIFISMEKGGIEAKADKETTQLSIRKALVTAVQRAPEAATAKAKSGTQSNSGQEQQDTTLPTGSLLVTVAVSDAEASKIVFAAEYASIWVGKEQTDSSDNHPGIIQRSEVYR
ncbi:Flp pilus assembly protein CpaB [Arthrobacter sp. M4]|uniref:Flp pilus assembly protein CpaB n=1 Tax=Arthrobacter sp. M4 TaxID=218160 RepID=UPI001CDD3AB3|nr:RcpC/CpaB family pilus assembly protein [Arthrobacter sp. M4]MCA4135136.1 flagellar biosynthesis protein FlgA [Arthrobacter sp. M4]